MGLGLDNVFSIVIPPFSTMLNFISGSESAISLKVVLRASLPVSHKKKMKDIAKISCWSSDYIQVISKNAKIVAIYQNKKSPMSGGNI